MLTPMEKLPILTALKKAVADELDAVRAECDGILKEAYSGPVGVEKIALKVDGHKVGDFLIEFKSEGFDITDRAAFEEFALDYGMATVKRTIRPDMMESAIKALEDVFPPDVMDETVQTEVVLHPDWEKGMTNVGGVVTYMDSGMNVPGVSYRPRMPKGTKVLKCKPKDVIPRLNQIEGGAQALLMGGDAA